MIKQPGKIHKSSSTKPRPFFQWADAIFSNTASGNCSFVGNGLTNTASNSFSTVINGSRNTVSGVYSSILGGACHKVTCNYSSILIGGGTAPGSGGNGGNTISGNYSSIISGQCNLVTHNWSSASGYGITSAADCAFHANCLIIQNTPTMYTAGLAKWTIFAASTPPSPTDALPLYIKII